jgi:hypothetical protein
VFGFLFDYEIESCLPDFVYFGRNAGVGVGCRVGGSSFLHPASPIQVWSRFIAALSDGSLLRHTAITLLEFCGSHWEGQPLGYSLAKSIKLEHALSPYIVASQSIPVVAIAPLLVIWFGPGYHQGVDLRSDRVLPGADQHRGGGTFGTRRPA